MDFLEFHARQLRLRLEKFEIVSGKIIVLMKWLGTEPDLPAILLNSHMDVTRVFDEWDNDPYSVVRGGEDRVYARGAQDSKCVGMQYLEAVRRLKLANKRLKRTIYITFMPGKTRFFLTC